ncbi:acyl carrier protein [Nocardia sp. CA-135953]|uniref:acyl carrier protein n=1 Tax=Nocardia sp. CA-135953 TaxID=3239978 RepID=UPI003D9892B6
MTDTTSYQAHMDELREIVCDVLEIEPDELTDDSLFVEDHEADSLRAIEILARLEKTYKVEIPQAELSKMVNMKAVYGVVAGYAGWH